MKNLFKIFFTLIIFSTYSYAQQDKNGPIITFEEQSHDFGDVTQGKKVSHKFSFENTGNQPLILSNVLTTCGCTVTEWPKDPVSPGKTGNIEVKFNTSGRMGKQNKVVTIISNATTPQSRIKITANVVE